MALEFSYQVLKGLKYIHANGLVHLDLKPGNIFICYPTEEAAQAAGLVKPMLIQNRQKVISPDILNKTCVFDNDKTSDNPRTNVPIFKIGDFGNVYKYDAPEQLSEPDEGDKRYLSDEILQEDYRHLTKSDIFALGISIHELWTRVEPPKHGQKWHEYRKGDLPFSTEKLKLIQSCRDSIFLQNFIYKLIHINAEERPSASVAVDILRERYRHALYRGQKRQRGRFSISPSSSPILRRK